MAGTGDGDSGRDRSRLSRRRLLALSGAGVLGSLVGCGGEGGTTTSEGPTETPTETATATGTPTATATATATETETAEPTETKSLQERIEEYGCPTLEKDPDIVVAKDGSGDYETVGAAIDAIPDAKFDGTQVYIKEGVYKEKLTLGSNKMDVTFLGDGPERTILTYDDHADKEGSLGDPIGTSASASFVVRGFDFTAKDITFRNDAEPVAQAVAVRTDGRRPMFVNCNFVGNQDTLYTRHEETKQYFKDCYIEGDVDFIFGAATAYFEGCEIFCKDTSGYVTAASTAEDREYGYVFNNCEITGGAPEDSFYLGRPWEPHAQTVFINTYMGEHIRPEGYHPWPEEDHGDKTETAYYAEYGNEGPGYTPEERVPWAHQLTAEEAEPYTDPATVFGDWDPEQCL